MDQMTPLDQVLAFADSADTPEGLALLRGMRRAVERGADPEPWVRGVQVARDLGVIDDDGACYLVSLLVEDAIGASIDQDATLRSIAAEMDAIERREGLAEDEFYFVNEAPADWQALSHRWDARFDAMQAEHFRRYGEEEMAAQLRLHPAEFRERCDRGWRTMLPGAADDPA